jgi:hypothetical protein
MTSLGYPLVTDRVPEGQLASVPCTILRTCQSAVERAIPMRSGCSHKLPDLRPVADAQTGKASDHKERKLNWVALAANVLVGIFLSPFILHRLETRHLASGS